MCTEEGLELAERCTTALYSDDSDSLLALSQADFDDVFRNATSSQMIYEPGLTLLDVCMRVGCFNREGGCDVMRARSFS